MRKVDQFIKKLASAKSYSTAKQARTVLSLAFGLAVRYDAEEALQAFTMSFAGGIRTS